MTASKQKYNSFINLHKVNNQTRVQSQSLPVYSAMDVDVMEDAVDPLSQSLSVARLELRLRPGNESTDSPLEREDKYRTQGNYKHFKSKN